MMEESDKIDLKASEDQVVSQLSEAVQTQVTLPGNGNTTQSEISVSNLPPPSSLPQFTSMTSIPNQPPPVNTVVGQQFPALSLPSILNQATPPVNQGSFPQLGPSLLVTGTPTPGPPPKAGFQPVPHAVQSYETTHIPSASHTPVSVAAPQVPQAGVNIFTPAYVPNTAPSPYSMPPQPPVNQYTASASDTPGSEAVQLTLDGSSIDSNYFQRQNSQDVGIIEWLKTNDTVNMVMQKAKTGVQHVITTLDPQMKDVLYSGGDINIVVASTKDVKVEPVKDAFQQVFGRATVSGMDSQPGIAPQPVGYTSGIKGAEERINNLRRSGKVTAGQVCVAVESFIVDIQPEMWYDVSCLMLSDPTKNIHIQTFSQATPVNLEYVHQAQSDTPKDYSQSWSGLAVTAGQVMHRQCAVDPSDWHFYFTGVSRKETLYLAAKQLAFMYQQRLPRN